MRMRVRILVGASILQYTDYQKYSLEFTGNQMEKNQKLLLQKV
jgi:hypothetical protein